MSYQQNYCGKPPIPVDNSVEIGRNGVNFMKTIINVHQELLTAVETSAYKDKVIVFGEGA